MVICCLFFHGFKPFSLYMYISKKVQLAMVCSLSPPPPTLVSTCLIQILFSKMEFCLTAILTFHLFIMMTPLKKIYEGSSSRSKTGVIELLNE